MVTGTTTNYVGNSVGFGIINWGPGIVTADPLMVTATTNLTSLLATNASIQYIPATAMATIAAFNVHLRGGRGYFDERTGELVDEYCRAEQSPAIDAGDPTSDFRNEPNCKIGYHGKRVNLGGYGNTPWATMTIKPGFFILLR